MPRAAPCCKGSAISSVTRSVQHLHTALTVCMLCSSYLCSGFFSATPDAYGALCLVLRCIAPLDVSESHSPYTVPTLRQIRTLAAKKANIQPEKPAQGLLSPCSTCPVVYCSRMKLERVKGEGSSVCLCACVRAICAHR